MQWCQSLYIVSARIYSFSKECHYFLLVVFIRNRSLYELYTNAFNSEERNPFSPGSSAITSLPFLSPSWPPSLDSVPVHFILWAQSEMQQMMHFRSPDYFTIWYYETMSFCGSTLRLWIRSIHENTVPARAIWVCCIIEPDT